MFRQRSGLHLFTAFGIDVFISLWYLILMAFIVFSSGGGGNIGTQLVPGIIFAVAITISLLVHEYGHGFVSKAYSLSPAIMLHAFGGLCFHQPAATDGDDAKILFAGPLAGLVFGGIAIGMELTLVPAVDNPLFGMFVADLVWINIVWSLANLLLPIWPLDGGKLFHLALRRFMPERKARDTTLKISVGTTIAAGALAMAYLGSLFLALLAFFIVLNNINMLQNAQPLVDRASNRSETSEFQSDLLDDAEEALESEEWDKAYRLCHQLRASGGSMGPDLLDQIWAILSVASTKLGKLDEADSYFKRAPETPQVESARREWERARAEGSDSPGEEAA